MLVVTLNVAYYIMKGILPDLYLCETWIRVCWLFRWRETNTALPILFLKSAGTFGSSNVSTFFLFSRVLGGTAYMGKSLGLLSATLAAARNNFAYWTSQTSGIGVVVQHAIPAES